MQIEICPCCGKPKKPKVHYDRYRDGHERSEQTEGKSIFDGRNGNFTTAPATPAAATWEGYGSALKPAVEVIVMARKPIEGTIAGNCERYGSGALAIDACRISANDVDGVRPFGCMPANKTGGNGFTRPWMDDKQSILDKQEAAIDRLQRMGRWPANLILDDSEAVAGLFSGAI